MNLREHITRVHRSSGPSSTSHSSKGSTATTHGIAYVEFLIVFPIVYFFFMATVQLSILGIASVLTQHAAHRATRTAVLVLDDDAQMYGGAPIHFSSGISASSPGDAVVKQWLQKIKTGGGSADPRELTRDQTIWLSAALLLAYVPGVAQDFIHEGQLKIEVDASTPSSFSDGVVELSLEYEMPCALPLVNALCGGEKSRVFTAKHALPRQAINNRAPTEWYFQCEANVLQRGPAPLKDEFQRCHEEDLWAE